MHYRALRPTVAVTLEHWCRNEEVLYRRNGLALLYYLLRKKIEKGDDKNHELPRTHSNWPTLMAKSQNADDMCESGGDGSRLQVC